MADEPLFPGLKDENRTHERVVFRLIKMPCCGQLLCWVNPRLMNFCPECGGHVAIGRRSSIAQALASSILVTDEDAMLTLTVKT